MHLVVFFIAVMLFGVAVVSSERIRALRPFVGDDNIRVKRSVGFGVAVFVLNFAVAIFSLFAAMCRTPSTTGRWISCFYTRSSPFS